jgi:hypothetical protein
MCAADRKVPKDGVVAKNHERFSKVQKTAHDSGFPENRAEIIRRRGVLLCAWHRPRGCLVVRDGELAAVKLRGDKAKGSIYVRTST